MTGFCGSDLCGSGQVLIKICHFDVYYLQPASGRDKSLRYIAVSKNGHVGQGFSPESSSGSLHLTPFTAYPFYSFFLTKGDSKSMGMGKKIVELFSVDISLTVCR